MSLVNLLNVPKDDIGWEYYAFNNRQQISQIRSAIKTKRGINLPEYQLYPLNLSKITDWLERKSAAHQDFNSVLGLQSSDLKDVDIKNEKQLESWIYLQYQELYSASAALGI